MCSQLDSLQTFQLKSNSLWSFMVSPSSLVFFAFKKRSPRLKSPALLKRVACGMVGKKFVGIRRMVLAALLQ